MKIFCFTCYPPPFLELSSLFKQIFCTLFSANFQDALPTIKDFKNSYVWNIDEIYEDLKILIVKNKIASRNCYFDNVAAMNFTIYLTCIFQRTT